ncbi:MAG: homoserine dehydrogenase [Verrucomicrobia bacterium RIFCSPLOWO2_12_FULL_64_8]|nr:MAG: homoserine dehydrogenase [Verrucomicrobia bacterium RIFCSPLOWO2_12_FULL_64_8]
MNRPAVINIGFCGLGIVGQGVWKHLQRNRAGLESRLGARLNLHRAAVRRPRKKRAVRIPAGKLTGNALAVATDPSVHIVCELIGGTGLARRVTLAALARGKVVVSANKALLCGHGAEIFAAARRGGGHYFFEASVAGGVPIIKALREGLVANRFKLIYGILNGTCNYILTRMEQERAAYAGVLADAKRLGYAEADESLDVQGWDTAHKAAILAYLAHGVWVKPEQMLVEGIERITPADIGHAAQLGYGIKLLAVITRDFATNELFVRVHPTLLPRHLVLASVNGVYNGIAVTGDVVGTTLYIGRGAGQDATASAVISDIADAAALLTGGKSVVVPDEAAAIHAGGGRVRLAPLARICSRYYLRMEVKDRPGVLAQVATVMAGNKVSIESVIQRASPLPAAATLILTTHESNEQAIQATLAGLRKLGSVLQAPLLLRIGDFEE